MNKTLTPDKIKLLKKDTLTQDEAKHIGMCKKCNIMQFGRCVETLWPSLNYRHTETGMCGLKKDERSRFLP